MCNFENSLWKRVNNDGLRLAYLKCYCRGPARKAIEGCSLFSPEEGYPLAFQKLYEFFGDEHWVSRLLLDPLKMISNAQRINQRVNNF